MSAVMAGLYEHDALLAAFLEATGKIDLRALRKRAATCEMPTPVNVEAHVASAMAAVPHVDPPPPPVPPFALRRPNLVRIPHASRSADAPRRLAAGAYCCGAGLRPRMNACISSCVSLPSLLASIALKIRS